MKSNKYNQFISSHKIYLDQCYSTTYNISLTHFLQDSLQKYHSFIRKVYRIFLLFFLLLFVILPIFRIRFDSFHQLKTIEIEKIVQQKKKSYTKCNKSKNINLSLSLNCYTVLYFDIRFCRFCRVSRFRPDPFDPISNFQ